MGQGECEHQVSRQPITVALGTGLDKGTCSITVGECTIGIESTEQLIGLLRG